MPIIATWVLIWISPGQYPIVIPDFATETACKQVIEDVLKMVPKKHKKPVRRGVCMPLTTLETVERMPTE